MRQLTLRLTIVAATVGVLTVMIAATVLTAIEQSSRLRGDAEGDLLALVSVAEVTSDEETLRRAIGRTATGRAGGIAVHIGTHVVGASRFTPDPAAPVPPEAAVEGGTVLLHAVPDSVTGRPTVVEAFVPSGEFGAAELPAAALLVAAGLLGGAGAAVICLRMVRPLVGELAGLVRVADRLSDGESPPVIEATRTAETAALASALAGIADRIEQARTSERQLLADLSHRLRTPLTALALDAGALGDGAAAHRVRRAIEALDTDVDFLIRADRSQDRAPIHCDVVAVVKRRMEFWSALGSHGGRPCAVRFDTESAMVALTAEDLGAVVDALLGNIFRYTPDGTGLAVTVVRHSGWVSLVVDDDGPGVADPATALRRGVSSSGSTGLGLAIARNAVEATGGTIHVERSPSGGARIRLRFAELGSVHARPHEPRAWRLWHPDGPAA